MRKNKFRLWVNREVAKNLDKDPFSSLPLKMRIGLLLLTISYIIGYCVPPVIIFLAGSKHQLTAGLVKGSIFYLGSWVIGGLGLFLASKDSLKYPIYFFAKALKFFFPGYFNLENPGEGGRSAFFHVSMISLLAGVVLLVLILIHDSPLWWVLLAGVVVLHQGLYIYGMFSYRTNYFFKTIKGKEFFKERQNGVLFRFDDGPDPLYTPRILDILKAESITALFAITGENAAKYRDIVTRMHEENHIIGNHTYTHPFNILLLGYKKVYAEIARTNDIIMAITGQRPVYFCPPIGQKNPIMGKVLKDLQMVPIMWDLRTVDTHFSTAKIMRVIRKKFKAPAIILFHDAEMPWSKKGRESTIEALMETIAYLKEKQYL